MTVSQVSSAEIDTFIRVAADLPHLLKKQEYEARPGTAAPHPYKGSAPSALTYNERVASIVGKVRNGEFGRAEIADLYTGNSENLLQVALRDLDSMLVKIVNLQPDGTFGPDPN